MKIISTSLLAFLSALASFAQMPDHARVLTTTLSTFGAAFSLVFSKNARTNFLFELGSIAATEQRNRSYYTADPNSNKSVSGSFSLTGTVSGIALGIQKLF